MRIVRVVIIAVALLVAAGAGPDAHAEPQLTVRIEKHAHRTAHGGVAFWVHVRCGPLPGSDDVREGHAEAAQSKKGAGAEGGLSPDIECDGVERRYTARLSAYTESAFRPGPALASAAVIACNVVGDDQVCVEGGSSRKIIIRGTPPG